jgi:hypothetical protein
MKELGLAWHTVYIVTICRGMSIAKAGNGHIYRSNLFIYALKWFVGIKDATTCHKIAVYSRRQDSSDVKEATPMRRVGLEIRMFQQWPSVNPPRTVLTDFDNTENMSQ